MLTKLEHLQSYAFDSGHIIHEIKDMSADKGCCLTDGETSIVILNKFTIENQADELCILAEEVGHLEEKAVLPFGDYLHPSVKRITKRKNEIRALRCAIAHILHSEEIQAALDDYCTNDYDIAEYCGVTVDFLVKSVEQYRRMGVTFTSPED